MRYTFQHQIATGRSTFPVAVLISLALWIVPFEDKTELLSLLAGGITSYLLIELNTTFALIRTRTEMPSALFLCTYSSLLFLHPYEHTCWIQLFFMGTLFTLFKSYESRNAPIHIFHAFFCLGLGSLIVNDLIWLVPLLFISMIELRSLTPRTFFAGLIGLSIPYWIIVGYHLAMEILVQESVDGLGISTLIKSHLNIIPFSSTLTGIIAEYKALGLVKGVSYGLILIISIIGTICSRYNSFNDKVRTRSFIAALIPLEIGIVLLELIHPALLDALLPIQIVFAAISCSYLFALVFTHFVWYLLLGVISIVGGIIFLNVWIH